MNIIIEPENTKEWEDWDMECMRIDAEISKFNNVQIDREYRIEEAEKLLSSLSDLGYPGYEIWEWIKTLPKPEELKNSEDYYPPEPL